MRPPTLYPGEVSTSRTWQSFGWDASHDLTTESNTPLRHNDERLHVGSLPLPLFLWAAASRLCRPEPLGDPHPHRNVDLILWRHWHTSPMA